MERRRRFPFLLCATRFAPGDSEWLLHISARELGRPLWEICRALAGGGERWAGVAEPDAPVRALIRAGSETLARRRRGSQRPLETEVTSSAQRRPLVREATARRHFSSSNLQRAPQPHIQ